MPDLRQTPPTIVKDLGGEAEVIKRLEWEEGGINDDSKMMELLEF